jgi:hypothetical protein
VKVCAGRHHVWNPAGVCTKCGAPKKGPGRPPGAAATSTKKTAGPTVVGRLASTLEIPQAPTSILGDALAAEVDKSIAETVGPLPPDLTKVGGTPADVEALEEAKKPRAPVVAKWTKPAGRRLAKFFVAACDWGVELFGREANEPDDEDVDDFGLAMGEQLTVWFPNAELTPAKQLMLSGACIVGGMCVGSKKIEKPPAKLALVKGENGTSAGTAGAAPSVPAVSSLSPATTPQA